MVSKKCVINYHMFTLCMVVFSANFGINSALRTLFVEELCYGTGYGRINLNVQKSVILSSVPSEEQNCKILVKTTPSTSLVVAFYRYHLYENDSLSFTDRHNFKLALDGEGYYVDERKYVILEGPVNIHYYTQHNRPDRKLKFQIVLTQVRDAPCSKYDEYQCQNNKCIPKDLACDQHNHCGDLTYQNKCTPGGFIQEVTKVTVTKPNSFLIAIGVSSVILLIVIIVFIVGVVKTCKNRRQKTQSTELPTALPTVAASVEPPKPPQVSVFSRIRQSFRGMRQPTAPPPPDSTGQFSESCEVPSMYPKLPSDISGVDNPDFKHDE